MKTINFISKLSASKFSQLFINSSFTQIIENSEVMNYFFCNKNLFLFHTLIDDQTVLETKSDQRINTEQKETVCLLLKNKNDEKTELILIDVLYVSKLNCNLMNILRLAKKEFEIFLRTNKFSEIHHKNMIIDLINLKNDLYILKIKSMKVKIEILTIKTKNSIEL